MRVHQLLTLCLSVSAKLFQLFSAFNSISLYSIIFKKSVQRLIILNLNPTVTDADNRNIILRPAINHHWSPVMSQSPQTSIIKEITRCRISCPPTESFVQSINCLDDYSLLLVFSKLSFVEKMNAQKVCKKWKYLIHKSIRCQTSIGVTISFAVCDDLRHQVTVNGCVGDLFDSAIEGAPNTKWYFVNAQSLSSVLSKCPNLKSLILQNCIFCKGVLDVFATTCSPNLEHLDMSHSSCNINEILQIISDKCSKTLKHVMLEDNKINESGLKCLISSCKGLEVLILDNNFEITGHCFELFGENIKYLSLIGCNSIDDMAIDGLIEGNGRNISHIRLGDSIIPSMFQKICERMPDLKILEFKGFKPEPNSSSIAYNHVSNLRTLQELILTVPRIPFDSQLIAISRNCSDLKVVKIDGSVITDIGLKNLAANCPLIEQISLIPCDSLANSSITDDCRYELGSLRYLKSLSLCGSSVTDRFVEIISLCPRLTFVELDSCKSITDRSLELFIRSARSRPSLKIMLFLQKTKILKHLRSIPPNLTVF